MYWVALVFRVATVSPTASERVGLSVSSSSGSEKCWESEGVLGPSILDVRKAGKGREYQVLRFRDLNKNQYEN